MFVSEGEKTRSDDDDARGQFNIRNILDKFNRSTHRQVFPSDDERREENNSFENREVIIFLKENEKISFPSFLIFFFFFSIE